MHETEIQQFARSVREARGKESQRQFALRIGVTEQSVGRWERGQSTPSGLGTRRTLERAGITCPHVAGR